MTAAIFSIWPHAYNSYSSFPAFRQKTHLGNFFVYDYKWFEM